VIELLIGGALVLAGFVLGRLRRPEKGPPAPPAPPAPPKEVCQCTHGVSTHDKAGCHAIEFITEKEIIGEEDFFDHYTEKKGVRAITNKKVVDQHECFCVRYVGPHSSYVPELEG
jgi:hypothetical protein